MNHTIEVLLTTRADADVLQFQLDEEHPETYSVNLNSTSSQNELKQVFSKLLELLMEEDIVLELSVADGYKKGLYKDVCVEYIKDLNHELIQVKEAILSELS